MTGIGSAAGGGGGGGLLDLDRPVKEGRLLVKECAVHKR